MEPLYVAMALLSAALHAGWNAAVKARPNVALAMTAQMVLAGLLMVPLLVWSGLPDRAAVPWMVLSTAINMVVVTAMLRGYALAGFGLVYPTARALSVLLVVPGAALFMGERLGPFGLIGVAGISVALALLAASSRSTHGPPRQAWLWIGVAGAMTAAYVLADAYGVRASGSAIAYGCCTSILNAVVMLWRQRLTTSASAAVSRAEVQRETLAMLPVAIASVASYLLILWIYTNAPVAPASALRDTSALFAVVLAVLWLKEPFTRLQAVALLVAAAAVPLLRLG